MRLRRIKRDWKSGSHRLKSNSKKRDQSKTTSSLLYFLPREVMSVLVRSLLPSGVRPYVCLSRWCIVSKRLNISSIFFIAWWPHHSSFPTVKIRWGHPSTSRGAKIEVGVTKIAIFNKHCISETMRDRAIYYGTVEPCHSRWPWMTLEVDPLSNFLVLFNIYGTDEAMHSKFGRQ